MNKTDFLKKEWDYFVRVFPIKDIDPQDLIDTIKDDNMEMYYSVQRLFGNKIKNDIYFVVKADDSEKWVESEIKGKFWKKRIKAIIECKKYDMTRTEDCYNYLLMLSENSRKKVLWTHGHIERINHFEIDSILQEEINNPKKRKGILRKVDNDWFIDYERINGDIKRVRVNTYYIGNGVRKKVRDEWGPLLETHIDKEVQFRFDIMETEDGRWVRDYVYLIRKKTLLGEWTL